MNEAEFLRLCRAAEAGDADAARLLVGYAALLRGACAYASSHVTTNYLGSIKRIQRVCGGAMLRGRNVNEALACLECGAQLGALHKADCPDRTDRSPVVR